MPGMAGHLVFREPMVITEKICEDVATDESLAEFQRKLGLPIPACYREFLKAHNGGRPSPKGFEFKDAQGKVEKDNIHYFFGLHFGRIGSLAQEFEMYYDRIPLGLLPIARDPFGNLVLVKLTIKRDAPVFFWDHELESEDEPTMDNVFLINESFENFIEALA
jgi:hypothetical protein